MIMRLFTLYGIDYHPFDEARKDYIPFYRIIEGKKTAYVFSKSITSRIEWKSIIEKYHVDRIVVVALVELGEDAKTRNSLVNFEIKKAKGYVEYITLKDLFSLISDTEYDIYLTYVEQYNSDIKKLIGNRTIITPSESSLLTTKKELEDMLRSYDFDNILRKDGLFTSQIETIKHHFLDDGRYRAVLGKSSFAESFISSEWYYQTHTVSSMLEQTAIIAGYLKSIEQLLYTIIRFSINTGKSIKKLGSKRNEYIEYTSDNESSADTTLESLIGYSRHYSDLWSVNHFVKNYIANKLSEFRESYRNDHFHKDNIYDSDEIENIRNNTILLIYLLLGAMNISDSDFASIDYVYYDTNSIQSKELSYERFEQWLDRIMGGDVLLPTSSNIFFFITGYGSEGTKWKIHIITYEDSDKHKYHNTDSIQFRYKGDEFEWDYTPASYENRDEIHKGILNQAKSVIKEYLIKSTYANKLKSYNSVAIGWIPSRPEIIYKRKT